MSLAHLQFYKIQRLLCAAFGPKVSTGFGSLGARDCLGRAVFQATFLMPASICRDCVRVGDCLFGSFVCQLLAVEIHFLEENKSRELRELRKRRKKWARPINQSRRSREFCPRELCSSSVTVFSLWDSSRKHFQRLGNSCKSHTVESHTNTQSQVNQATKSATQKHFGNTSEALQPLGSSTRSASMTPRDCLAASLALLLASCLLAAAHQQLQEPQNTTSPLLGAPQTGEPSSRQAELPKEGGSAAPEAARSVAEEEPKEAAESATVIPSDSPPVLSLAAGEPNPEDTPTRTTVKKELAQTSTAAPQTVSGESERVSNGNQTVSGGSSIIQTPQTVSGAARTPQTVAGEALAAALPAVQQVAGQLAEGTLRGQPSSEAEAEGRLMARPASFFSGESAEALGDFAPMDCHLRNVDLCFAGLIGAMGKLLPETEREFEARCDEMRATSSCLALYNKRCASLKAFALLAPVSAGDALAAMPAQVRAAAHSPALALPAELAPEASRAHAARADPAARNNQVGVADLASACEPTERQRPEQQEIRRRIFQLAGCLNGRVPKLTPCLDDLKAAIQIFYEPRRSIPLRPTCCALSRFRSCSTQALDQVCGLRSFDQLLASFGQRSAPIGLLAALERLCNAGQRAQMVAQPGRKSLADSREPQAREELHKSAYCADVLPPSGLRAPQRRGRKASKLAKALDLISFAPAAQDSTLVGR